MGAPQTTAYGVRERRGRVSFEHGEPTWYQVYVVAYELGPDGDRVRERVEREWPRRKPDGTRLRPSRVLEGDLIEAYAHAALLRGD